MYWFCTASLLFVQPFLGKSVFLVFKLWLIVLLCEMPSILSCPKGGISVCSPLLSIYRTLLYFHRSSDLYTCSQRHCRIYRTTIIQGIHRFSLHCTDHQTIGIYLPIFITLRSLSWNTWKKKQNNLFVLIFFLFLKREYFFLYLGYKNKAALILWNPLLMTQFSINIEFNCVLNYVFKDREFS